MFLSFGGQLNFQVPFEVAGKTTTKVIVNYFGSPSAAATVPVLPSQPAETTLDKDGDFDPMSVLEGNVDSDIMPALPDSAIREDIMLDMSDSRQQREG